MGSVWGRESLSAVLGVYSSVGSGALVGLEEGEASCDGVFGSAGLLEGGVCRVGEGCRYCDGEDCGWDGFDFQRGDCQCCGERENGGEDGEESPGELEEGEFGGVVPDECGEGGEKEGDGDGEDGEGNEEGEV